MRTDSVYRGEGSLTVPADSNEPEPSGCEGDPKRAAAPRETYPVGYEGATADFFAARRQRDRGFVGLAALFAVSSSVFLVVKLEASNMSAASNVALVERYYYELWNRFDTGLLPELLTEDVRFRGSLGQYKVGHAQFAEYMDFVRRAFPDFTNHVEEVVSEGDRSFARLTYRGTHRGELFGVAATNRRVEYAGVALFRCRDGRIAEVWVLGDVHGLLQQLTAAS